MEFLNTTMIINLHKDLIASFGGLSGIRDRNLLESAVGHPQLLYSIGLERNKCVLAASYCYHLVKNHPFLDGNKRIGTLAMITFLRINNVQCYPPKKDLYELVLKIANSQITEKEITHFLIQYSTIN